MTRTFAQLCLALVLSSYPMVAGAQEFRLSAEIFVTCYEGSAQMHDAEGNQIGGSSVLVRRTANPALSTIIEQAIEYGSSFPDALPDEHELTLVVMGNQLSFAVEGQYAGRGTLTGEAWHWTEWETTSMMSDGTIVLSTARVGETGLDVRKDIRLDGETTSFVITESLVSVDCANFEQLRANALGLPR